MVRLAGQPILGHILSRLAKTAINEVVIVVGGPMQEQIIEYCHDSFDNRFDFTFVDQQSAEGLGHSIYQAESVLRGDPVFITLGDMLFENGYETFLEAHVDLGDVDGSLGLKQVDEPQHYGVAELNGEGCITNLVEKPDQPPSNEAISGVYIIENSEALFDALTVLVENDIRGAGNEYQLTDALQRMVDQGSTLSGFKVEDWYDCGRPKTLLDANRVLLSKQETADEEQFPDSILIPPVDVGEDVSITGSVVGPNVSLDSGSQIESSIVRDSIVSQNAALCEVNIEKSIVGDNATVGDEANQLNVGDNSNLQL